MSGLILFLEDVLDWLQTIINRPQPEPMKNFLNQDQEENFVNGDYSLK